MSLINHTTGPHTVIESYSFNFRYDHGHLSSIRLTPTNHIIIFGAFERGFKAAIRAQLRSLRDLPLLPGSTTFTVLLLC